jgi:hypothetical protein
MARFRLFPGGVAPAFSILLTANDHRFEYLWRSLACMIDSQEDSGDALS